MNLPLSLLYIHIISPMQTVSNQSRKRIEVVDLDTGNIASVQKMLARIGLESATGKAGVAVLTRGLSVFAKVDGA